MIISMDLRYSISIGYYRYC